MKFIKPILFVLAFVFSANTLFAQNMIADPSTWTFETKHVKDNHYQLIFHLKLKEGWHIWSLNPGGDGFQIVPSFKIKKNDAVIKLGSFKEKGNAITELMDGVDGKVTYFKSKVDYIAEL